MSQINNKQIIEKLSNIQLPGNIGVVSQYIKDISIEEKNITIVLDFPSPKIAAYADKSNIQAKCEELITNQWAGFGVKTIITCSAKEPQAKPTRVKQHVQGVKKIIMIASGKGGVGKSTISLNLAISLSKQGYKVGLLDADIYGPSIAKMTGITAKPALDKAQMMVPHKKYGLSLMSVGFLVEEYNATVWRGPMVTKMIYQLLSKTAWDSNNGELDFLIIDTPPGTGDVHLSLAENYNLDGAIIISTPQEIALIDAKKAVSMCQKLNIPVLGVVENMSFLLDANGNKTYLFGKGNVRDYARSQNLNFLGQVPLNTEITKGSDQAKPITFTHPEEHISLIFRDISSQALHNIKS